LVKRQCLVFRCCYEKGERKGEGETEKCNRMKTVREREREGGRIVRSYKNSKRKERKERISLNVSEKKEISLIA
jgi:hypothetical protein